MTAPIREGSLQAPTRHPLDWNNPEFHDEAALHREMERVFNICHGCRRCVSLCHAFPTLFDLVDNSPSMEVDGVPKADYGKVVEHCYLCDLCFMTKCPYVPPHEWNVDFPHLMLRAKAVQFRQGATKLRDRVLTSTDAVGRFAGIPVVAQTVNAVNKIGPARKALEALAVNGMASSYVHISDTILRTLKGAPNKFQSMEGKSKDQIDAHQAAVKEFMSKTWPALLKDMPALWELLEPVWAGSEEGVRKDCAGQRGQAEKMLGLIKSMKESNFNPTLLDHDTLGLVLGDAEKQRSGDRVRDRRARGCHHHRERSQLHQAGRAVRFVQKIHPDRPVRSGSAAGQVPWRARRPHAPRSAHHDRIGRQLERDLARYARR